MRAPTPRFTTPLFAALIAFAITACGQGLWGLLVIANLATTPALPWAAGLMVGVLAAMVAFLSGRSWPRAGAEGRRRLVSLRLVSGRAFAWSMVAGGCAVVASAGLWIVLTSLVKTPPNILPDWRTIPRMSLIAFLLVGIAAAPISEEIAFRGYALGLLRRAYSPTVAIVGSSLMFALAHLTQGLHAPKLAVYFAAGLALAAIAWRTGSLLPAMAVHAAADLTFFTLVWPNDATRRLVSPGGADAWFWIHLAQVVVFGALSLFAFARLWRVTRPDDAGGGLSASPPL